MATIGEIPAIYHDTAADIPPDVLGDLTVLEATARCVASERLKASGLSHSDPTAARATLHLSCQVLREAPDEAADIRAKAAATSDPVLRRGYYALAEQQTSSAARPSDTDRIIAEAALSTRVTRQVRKLTKPGPARTRLAASIRRQVEAATAPAQARMEALSKEIDAVTRQRAAGLAAADSGAPVMLFKSRAPSSGAAERYRQLAAAVDDPQAARGYRDLAEQAERDGQ
ncbi:hypothetical protein [Amycolatopsis sp. NPDC051716]|uniref:hypothetical protein n=1 Tax=Amycolatopsis sp. NPDC051716 TaxID=3155804 RepID=UPI0034135479